MNLALLAKIMDTCIRRDINKMKEGTKYDQRRSF